MDFVCPCGVHAIVNWINSQNVWHCFCPECSKEWVV